MPSRRPDGTELSGHEKKQRTEAQAKELKDAPPLPPEILEQLPAPPDDPLLLQLWGARCAAVLAHTVLVNPGAIKTVQLNTAQRFLATLGMLFPRSEMVARLERASKKRAESEQGKDMEPLNGRPPGPGSRRRARGG